MEGGKYLPGCIVCVLLLSGGYSLYSSFPREWRVPELEIISTSQQAEGQHNGKERDCTTISLNYLPLTYPLRCACPFFSQVFAEWFLAIKHNMYRLGLNGRQLEWKLHNCKYSAGEWEY